MTKLDKSIKFSENIFLAIIIMMGIAAITALGIMITLPQYRTSAGIITFVLALGNTVLFTLVYIFYIRNEKAGK